MRRFDFAFRRLLNKPCWGVRGSVGSFLTMDFGAPHLEVYDRPAVELDGKTLPARRLAYVRGEWQLQLLSCDWAIFDPDGRVVGDCSSSSRIDRAARYLNGQAIVGATLVRRGVRTLIDFDLGARLETRPYNRRGAQWMLFEPEGKVLTVRADKFYSYEAARPQEKIKWRLIPREA